MRGWPVSRILSNAETRVWMTIRLERLLPDALWLPTRTTSASSLPAADILQAGSPPRVVPIWHCSRWGLPCRRCCHLRGGLLPHRFTFSPNRSG